MKLEIDHLFICTPVDAPAGRHLIDFGWQEGSGNAHEGQGTANRRFFCHNAMLELLWVTDAAMVRGYPVSKLKLWERWNWKESVYSPFGICLRGLPAESLPFEYWDYLPPYLPDNRKIQIAFNSLYENDPLLFHLAFADRPDSLSMAARPPLDHAFGGRELTAVEITFPPQMRISRQIQTVVDMGVLNVKRGRAHVLELEFDGAKQGAVRDFRPELPLVIHY